MKRRDFIRVTSVALLPLLLRWTTWTEEIKPKWKVLLFSDREAGHLVRERASLPILEERETDFVIVGGGIAGVTAAYLLRDKKCALFEVGATLGGTSSSGDYKALRFGQGAHYDLAYPDYYGKEPLDLLLELDLIEWNENATLYTFKDTGLAVPVGKQEHCFENEIHREDVLGDAEEVDAFHALMDAFVGKMPMPTTLIEEELHHLDQITFKAWLLQKHPFSAELLHRISYQMIDDWGAGVETVSAMAGIHYYACRPYQEQDVQLFGPPEGNYYFIDQMLAHISPGSIHVRSLVSKLETLEDGSVLAEIIDIKQRGIIKVKAKKAIYAAQKYTLPYICQEAAHLYQENDYAPWVVVNLILQPNSREKGYWQNDFVTEENNFLGFVDPFLHLTTEEDEAQVLTAYYCFKPEERAHLIDLEKQPETIVKETLAYIEKYSGENLEPFLIEAQVKIMGHAMPIPKPGYLTAPKTLAINNNIGFAGVDTGRLPLFFEAISSALEAVKGIKDIG